MKIVILNVTKWSEESSVYICHSSEACPCERMSPLRRQGRGAGIQKAKYWIPGQARNDIVEGLRFFAEPVLEQSEVLRMRYIRFSTEH